MQPAPLGGLISRISLALIIVMAAGGAGARAEDKLLAEAVDFTGTFIFLEAKVPGLVIGAIRNGETVVRGYGEITDGSGKEPDGDTLMRIGSITKVFCGATLASMVADGSINFTDKLQDRLGWDVAVPERDGKQIRLIDLVTHASGLPREAETHPGEVPTSDRSKEDYIASLKPDALLFAPGTGVLYSNFGFDLLAQALANTAGKPYPELLRERVLEPAGLKDTRFDLAEADRQRAMQGHNFDGSPMPFISTSPMIVGAGGLYSTTNDILRWLAWHLDRFGSRDAEMRLLDHAAYLERDGLTPVFGMDEGGTMDAMGLGWVVMRPEGSRPLIMHKSGGLQGQFSFVAFAPARGIGVFVSMNQFSVSGFDVMAKAAIELITELAPR
ncbi:MAG TPA: D-alanyl-D-alanine-carboxypeptidase/endopeptidase AmpH [Methyloceanibacter sp.]|nr:D-alanyl-D-alanine-carboxypeptidase/endopeptidase AmpH [Methyloceanibacter sp.]